MVRHNRSKKGGGMFDFSSKTPESKRDECVKKCEDAYSKPSKGMFSGWFPSSSPKAASPAPAPASPAPASPAPAAPAPAAPAPIQGQPVRVGGRRRSKKCKKTRRNRKRKGTCKGSR